jgi:hypothetical protein
MLLFYEDEPGSTEITQQPFELHNFSPTPNIDPLLQYGSHAFIPYPSATAQDDAPSEDVITSAANHASTSHLAVSSPSSWTYCGPLLQPDKASLPPSFHTWANITLSSPSTLLTSLLPLLSWLQSFLLEAKVHNYWLTIRCTAPNHKYDTPRWHTDENFFAYDADAPDLGFAATSKERCWKLCTTLLGPGTLFLKDNEMALGVIRETKKNEKDKMGSHTCTSIRCLGCSTYAETVRESLACSLQNMEIESPAIGEVAYFRIGGEEGAVHSEPRCDTDRIFINVIPGTEQDLRSLMERWGMEFPRAWCFGMPVGFVESDEACTFLGA